MNLRCMYCQTMFGISRENMLIALQTMEAENLSHFDFHCPKCRRANRVEREKLELANPNWQETLKEMAKEAAKAEKEEKPAKAEKTCCQGQREMIKAVFFDLGGVIVRTEFQAPRQHLAERLGMEYEDLVKLVFRQPQQRAGFAWRDQQRRALGRSHQTAQAPGG
jgi:hypothetical protein